MSRGNEKRPLFKPRKRTTRALNLYGFVAPSLSSIIESSSDDVIAQSYDLRMAEQPKHGRSKDLAAFRTMRKTGREDKSPVSLQAGTTAFHFRRARSPQARRAYRVTRVAPPPLSTRTLSPGLKN
jgi:hypothetical protein